MFYVYVHIREDTNQIFYVGKGKCNRCFSKQNRNKHWKHIVESVSHKVHIIANNLDEELAFLCEKELISKLKQLGTKLVNYTDGGEGVSGLKHSKESKEKMSAKQKGRQTRERNPFYGKKHDNKTKQKMSELKLGKPTWNAGKKNVYSEETKQKMSNAKLGLFKTYIWWNNGEVNTRSETCPGEDWVRGVIRKPKL